MFTWRYQRTEWTSAPHNAELLVLYADVEQLLHVLATYYPLSHEANLVETLVSRGKIWGAHAFLFWCSGVRVVRALVS